MVAESFLAWSALVGNFVLKSQEKGVKAFGLIGDMIHVLPEVPVKIHVFTMLRRKSLDLPGARWLSRTSQKHRCFYSNLARLSTIRWRRAIFSLNRFPPLLSITPYMNITKLDKKITLCENILELHDQRMTTNQIAQKLGTYPAKVNRVLKQNGLNPLKAVSYNSKYSSRIPEILSLFDSGMLPVQISQQTQIPLTSVWVYLRKNGRKSTWKRVEHGQSELPIEERKKKLEQRYPGIFTYLGNMEFTLEEIGQRYHITRERIRQFERMFELPERMPILHEGRELRTKLRKLESANRFRARKQKQRDRALLMVQLMGEGKSKEEIISAVCPNRDPRTFSQCLQYYCRMGKVEYPKFQFYGKYNTAKVSRSEAFRLSRNGS